MMPDLNLLNNLINNKTLNPSEKYAEEHFDQIVNFIEQEQTSDAAKLIEKVFAKQVPDIRLIVYYFYTHFAEHGIQSFEHTFPIIISLVNDHWDLLTPKNRIDKHVQNSLNWFFSHILLRLKYYEKLHTAGQLHPVWQKCTIESSSEDLSRLMAIARNFEKFFLEKWPDSPTKDRVLHLVKRIEEIESLVGKKAIDNEETEEVAQTPEAAAQTPLEPPEEPCEKIDNEVQAFPPEPEFQEQEPISSGFEEAKDPLPLFIEKLDALSRKLKIFESLIGKNDYLKAAIVAHDIDQLIENFDPLEYFPKLFAPYFSLFARHVAALSEQYEQRDTLQVKALEKLYRTDFDLFIEW